MTWAFGSIGPFKKEKKNDWTDNYDIQERKGVRLFTLGLRRTNIVYPLERILFYTSPILTCYVP